MKKIVIYGTASLADIAADLVGKAGWQTAGYVVSDEYFSRENDYGGKNVIPFSQMAEVYPPEEYDAVIGMMVSDLQVTREDIYRKVKALGYSFPNLIHPSAVVETETIGEGNIILSCVSIDRRCKIGDMNLIWQNVVLPHDNELGSFCNLAPSVSFSGGSRVLNHCFLGNNSALNNFVTVHDFGFVGAGAFVSSDLPEYGVVVPARSVLLENKKSTEMGF